MKVSLIATGNEVVSGQIINTNASLLAKLLSDIGCDVASHHVAGDDAGQIKKTFQHAIDLGADQIFVIGGLGPTRDDLTRKIVGDFFNLEMEFHKSLWEELKKELISRKITPRKGHEWQCFFPKGSEVFENPVGTAQAFRSFNDKVSIWCLPGPPHELKAVFKKSILDWIKKRVNPHTNLQTWQCIGVPESELAHKVEEVLKGCPYELGFRASPPIIEVKLWTPLSQNKESKMWVEKIDEAVEEFLFSKDEEDYLKKAFSLLLEKYKDICFVDEITEGYVLDQVKKSFSGVPKGFSYYLGQSDSTSRNEIKFFKADNQMKLSLFNKDIFEFAFPKDVKKITRRWKRHAFIVLAKELWLKTSQS